LHRQIKRIAPKIYHGTLSMMECVLNQRITHRRRGDLTARFGLSCSEACDARGLLLSGECSLLLRLLGSLTGKLGRLTLSVGKSFGFSLRFGFKTSHLPLVGPILTCLDDGTSFGLPRKDDRVISGRAFSESG
jgi:hypothetical protein